MKNRNILQKQYTRNDKDYQLKLPILGSFIALSIIATVPF